MTEDFVAPQPYDPERFADREYELRQIGRKVEEGLACYPITQSVIHVWGLRGVGKSWLLSHLKDTYAFVSGRKMEKNGTFSILVDFSRSPFTLWEPLTIVAVFTEIADQIKQQLRTVAHRANQRIEAFEAALDVCHASGSIFELTHLAEQLAALINHLSATLVPLLLFDATERLRPDDFFWLESHLIEPIVRHDQVIVIIAGRKEIPRWLEFGVRQRMTVWELREFDREGTRRQLELAKQEHEHLSDLVYSLSFGHPYANQMLAGRLRQLAGEQSISETFVQDHSKAIAAILGEVEDRLLSEVESDKLREILRVLSVLRKFNIESARHMLSFCSGAPYRRLSDASFLKLFEELERTTLAWWNKEQRGYAVAPALRRIMDLRSRKQDAEEYTKRHDQAYGLYAAWMRKYPYERSNFLVEALFQLASATAYKTHSERQELVERFLDQALVPEYFSSDSADTLFQTVYRDTELQDPDGAMSSVLYARVLDRIRAFRDQIAELEPAEGSQDERGVHAHAVPARSIR
jgi:hypothetical protein